MKLSDIKTLLENKLSSLEGQRISAIATGDIASLDRVDIEIEETTQTINQLG